MNSPATPADSAPTVRPSRIRRALGSRFKLRREVSRLQALLLGTSCCVFFFLAWWLITLGDGSHRIVSPVMLPSPRETFAAFPDLWASEVAPKEIKLPANFGDGPLAESDPTVKVEKKLELLPNTLATLRRVALGFLLAMAVGVPVGVLAGCFPALNSFLAPVVTFGRNIPLAAIVGLLFLILGTGETYKVMFIFVACVAFIITDTTRAITDVASRYVDTAYTLGASTWQVITKVLVPLAMPTVFSSGRLLFGIAFGYIMLAESTRSSESAAGLGYQIAIFQKRASPEAYYMIVLIIPLVALLVDQLLVLIQRQWFPHVYGGAGYLRRLQKWFANRWEDLLPFFFETRSTLGPQTANQNPPDPAP